MTDEDSPPWNEEGRINCRFAFKCPQRWSHLQPTATEGVRHCPEYERDVHYEPVYAVGMADSPYRQSLKLE